MKKIKNFYVLSDGSCYFEYNTITSIKYGFITFQKKDYKNSNYYNNTIIKNIHSKHLKKYKNKFFSKTKT